VGFCSSCFLGDFLLLSGLAMVASKLTVISSVSKNCFSVHHDSLSDKFKPGRFPLAFQVVPGLTMAIGIWFLQESPRWLIEKDRHEDARLVLQKLHGNGSNEEFLDLEYKEIRDTIVAEKTLLVQT
jgi:hypothetical protein